jgi:hypothetical protein
MGKMLENVHCEAFAGKRAPTAVITSWYVMLLSVHKPKKNLHASPLFFGAWQKRQIKRIG